MICLPLPRSSAGVPRKTISPGSSSAIAASAMAAPTPEAAIVLWPQPWPRPGSASYSARIPIRGPSPPTTAAAHGPDRRREAARRVLDLEAVGPQCLGDPGRGLVLLERGLRIRMDPMRQVDDLVAGAFDGGGDAFLDVGERLGGADGGTVRARILRCCAWIGPSGRVRGGW